MLISFAFSNKLPAESIKGQTTVTTVVSFTGQGQLEMSTDLRVLRDHTLSSAASTSLPVRHPHGSGASASRQQAGAAAAITQEARASAQSLQDEFSSTAGAAAAARGAILRSHLRRTQQAAAGAAGATTGSATQQRYPKVALMFLAQREVPHEPLWRAFLEQASKMAVPAGAGAPPLPPAAEAAQQARAAGAAAAQQAAAAAAADVQHLKHNMWQALAPAIPTLPDELLPGYKVQHGITPGALQQKDHTVAEAAQRLASSTGAAMQRVRAAVSSRRRQLSGGTAHRAMPSDAADPTPTTTASKASAGMASEPSVHQQQQGEQQQQEEPAVGYQDALAWEDHLLQEDSKRLLDLHTTDDGGSSSESHPSEGSGSGQPQQAAAGTRHGWERFFSLYVHNDVGHSFPEGSIFHGREVAGRVNTTQGYAQHVLLKVGQLCTGWPGSTAVPCPALHCRPQHALASAAAVARVLLHTCVAMWYWLAR